MFSEFGPNVIARFARNDFHPADVSFVQQAQKYQPVVEFQLESQKVFYIHLTHDCVWNSAEIINKQCVVDFACHMLNQV